MTTAIEYLVPKVPVMQYDGTNWSDLLTVLPAAEDYDLTLISEVDGVATFSYYEGFTATATIATGDYIAAWGFPGSGYPTVVSPGSLDGFVKLSDLA